MIRRLVAGLIVVGLAVGIWALWPREDSDTTPTTLPVAVETTTTTPVTSTTVADSTTTSADGSHVVTTVEEAEAILRELIYRRLLGIFRQDEGELTQIVASERALDSAVQAFGRIEFEQQPTLAGVVLEGSELLRADEECLAVWTELDVSAFQGEEAISSGVVLLRRVDDDWRWASVWQFRDDLWEADCDAQLEPLL